MLEGYTTWCDSCSWNLVPLYPSSEGSGLRDRLFASAGRKLGSRLAEELAVASSLEPRLTGARFGTYAIATIVFSLTIAIAVTGAALIVVGALAVNVIEIVCGLLLVALAWLMRPRFGRFPKEEITERADAPTLYDLVDRVTAEMGARPVAGVVLDSEWNAAWGILGIRRRGVLRLGVPLFHALEAQQRVALIGHEIAHGRNGDSSRGLVVGSSISGLSELCSLFLDRDPDEDALGTLLVRPLLWLVSRPFYYLLRLQVNLAQHDGHRAEYLADALAARVAGTDAVVGLHERLLLESVFELAVQRAAQSSGEPDLFDSLAQAVRAVPAREIERRRRVARLADSRLDATHPPTGSRIELLEGRPKETGTLFLSEQKASAIDSELRPSFKAMQRSLVDDFRSSIHQG